MTPKHFLARALLRSDVVRWHSLTLGSDMDFKWSLVPVLDYSSDEDTDSDAETRARGTARPQIPATNLEEQENDNPIQEIRRTRKAKQRQCLPPEVLAHSVPTE